MQMKNALLQNYKFYFSKKHESTAWLSQLQLKRKQTNEIFAEKKEISLFVNEWKKKRRPLRARIYFFLFSVDCNEHQCLSHSPLPTFYHKWCARRCYSAVKFHKKIKWKIQNKNETKNLQRALFVQCSCLLLLLFKIDEIHFFFASRYPSGSLFHFEL